MKRILIMMLAALMVFGLLTGCSAGGYAYGDAPMGSNVSTTNDGTVNGTNYRTNSGSRRAESGAAYGSTYNRTGSTYNR